MPQRPIPRWARSKARIKGSIKRTGTKGGVKGTPGKKKNK